MTANITGQGHAQRSLTSSDHVTKEKPLDTEEEVVKLLRIFVFFWMACVLLYCFKMSVVCVLDLNNSPLKDTALKGRYSFANNKKHRSTGDSVVVVT